MDAVSLSTPKLDGTVEIWIDQIGEVLGFYMWNFR